MAKSITCMVRYWEEKKKAQKKYLNTKIDKYNKMFT